MGEVVINGEEGLDAIFEPEELEPELARYMREIPGLGQCIQHPYVYSIMHWPHLNRHVNGLYRQKVKAIPEAREARDWCRYIRLHERAYRVNALTEIQEQMTDREYWEQVGRTWMDAENIEQVLTDWIDLWENPRPHRVQAVMDKEERKALAALPGRITIYRGVGVEEGLQGLSWTLTRAVAVRMANRYHAGNRGPNIVVGCGQVHKRFVLAHFLARNEDEIVVMPHRVRNVTIEIIPASRRRS